MEWERKYGFGSFFPRSFHRQRDGIAEAFTKLEIRPTTGFVDGTFFVGDGFIVIYADKFSEYAIGYTQKSSGSVRLSPNSRSRFQK